jgi:hypothetical protein
LHELYFIGLMKKHKKILGSIINRNEGESIITLSYLCPRCSATQLSLVR